MRSVKGRPPHGCLPADWVPTVGQAVCWTDETGRERRGVFLWHPAAIAESLALEWSTVEEPGGELAQVLTCRLRPGRDGGQLSLL